MPWLTADAHQEQVEAARELVLRRLDRSPAPRAALVVLLERKEVASRVADEVLDRLEAAGVVDDRAYASALARTRFAEKGVARRAIADELRLKGLGESAICDALGEARDAGVKVVTFDSDTNPECRDLFVNQADAAGIAKVQVDMIAEQIGGAGEIAILSASANATNQNTWIEMMKQELSANSWR